MNRSLSYCHPAAEIIYQTRKGISNEKTRITIAYETTETTIKYQVACCAPHENFSRKEGRDRALERFTATPITLVPITTERALDTIMGDIMANHLPSRWIHANLNVVK